VVLGLCAEMLMLNFNNHVFGASKFGNRHEKTPTSPRWFVMLRGVRK